jgi:hypothetical protein
VQYTQVALGDRCLGPRCPRSARKRGLEPDSVRKGPASRCQGLTFCPRAVQGLYKVGGLLKSGKVEGRGSRSCLSGVEITRLTSWCQGDRAGSYTVVIVDRKGYWLSMCCCGAISRACTLPVQWMKVVACANITGASYAGRSCSPVTSPIKCPWAKPGFVLLLVHHSGSWYHRLGQEKVTACVRFELVRGCFTTPGSKVSMNDARYRTIFLEATSHPGLELMYGN